VKVLVLYPDMVAATEDAPNNPDERFQWLQEKVGGYVEHVTYLKMIMDDDTLNGVRGSMYVNEEGALPHHNLPFNYLATLLYLEASRHNKRIASDEYPAIIRGVAIVMPRAET